MNYGPREIDNVFVFALPVSRYDTGAAADVDAAGVPAYRVYEDETGTPILTGNMALLDNAGTVGLYSEAITLSAANGFEKGKSYHIHMTATVNSIAMAWAHNFQIDRWSDKIMAVRGGAGNIATVLAELATILDLAESPQSGETTMTGAELTVYEED